MRAIEIRVGNVLNTCCLHAENTRRLYAYVGKCYYPLSDSCWDKYALFPWGLPHLFFPLLFPFPIPCAPFPFFARMRAEFTVFIVRFQFSVFRLCGDALLAVHCCQWQILSTLAPADWRCQLTFAACCLMPLPAARCMLPLPLCCLLAVDALSMTAASPAPTHTHTGPQTDGLVGESTTANYFHCSGFSALQ